MELLSLRRLSTAAIGTLMSLEPAAALLVGLVILGQVPGVLAVLGIGFVVAAGIGAQCTGGRDAPGLDAPAEAPCPEHDAAHA